MNKKLIAIGIVLVFLMVGFSGCTNNPLDIERNKFIGTWTCIKGASKGTSITCFSDGTGSLVFMSMIWSLKDGKFVISYDSAVSIAYNYLFSNDDNQLTLTAVGSSTSEVFVKQ
jgi:hypothetical protein